LGLGVLDSSFGLGERDKFKIFENSGFSGILGNSKKSAKKAY
jgi:hypothetical protein